VGRNAAAAMSAGPPVKGVDPRAEPEDDGVARLIALERRILNRTHILQP
jgi:hypothetical protein